MTKRLQVYETPEITVSFDPNVCKHSGVCLRGLPGVFDVRRAHWIRPEAADPNEVASTIQRCPSGALQFYRNVARNPSAKESLARATLMNQLAVVVGGPGDRTESARAVCAAISRARGYRWVGVYDVRPPLIEVVAWSGDDAPAHPRFSIDEGLNGVAVRGGETVVANDVGADDRYLATDPATRAEMIVPVLDRASGDVVGTIDVASEHVDAFADHDRHLLEDCAQVIAPLWTERS